MQQHFCTHCGQVIDPYANFCPYCGAATQKAANGGQAAAPTAPTDGAQTQVHTVIPPAPQPAATVTAVEPAVTTEQRDPLTIIIERRHLAPRAKYLFFLNYVVMTSILLPFMIGFMFFDPLFAIIMSTVYFMICFIVAMITYNSFFFSIDSSGFEKEYGVFFKRHVGIPYEQIQNVNITRTIFDRILGIARLDIETAGSSSPRKREIVGGIRSNSEGHLPGITFEDARYFHDLLLQKVAASKD